MAADIATYELKGTLDFSTVPDLWPQLRQQIEQHTRLRVSLAAVKQANSAALALLLEGLELAQHRGCALRYEQIPEELLALARVSNVAELLGMHS